MIVPSVARGKRLVVFDGLRMPFIVRHTPLYYCRYCAGGAVFRCGSFRWKAYCYGTMKISSCGRHNAPAERYVGDFSGHFRNSLHISNTDTFNQTKYKGSAEIFDRI
jgi:hypothetical protein